jgi:hypothetical protein
MNRLLLIILTGLALWLAVPAPVEATDCPPTGPITEPCVSIDPPSIVREFPIYLPFVADYTLTDREILITLIDRSVISRLPITIVVSSGSEVVFTAIRTHETREIRIWSFPVEVARDYRIQWFGPQGDACSVYNVYLTQNDHLRWFAGVCTFWRTEEE